MSRVKAAKKGSIGKRVPGKETAQTKADVFTLGLNLSDPLSVHRDLLAGLPFASLSKFEKASKLARVEIADLISTPVRTLDRRRKERHLRPDESERLFRLASVFRLARDLFAGDDEAAQRWLRTPRPALGGKTPLDLCRTEVGARQVEGLIHQLEHGVYV